MNFGWQEPARAVIDRCLPLLPRLLPSPVVRERIARRALVAASETDLGRFGYSGAASRLDKQVKL